jgi:hypothetical protein
LTGRSTDRQLHWQKVYQTRAVDAVSGHRPHLDVSLELMAALLKRR